MHGINKTSFLLSNQSKKMNRKQGISTYPMNHLKYETCIET